MCVCAGECGYVRVAHPYRRGRPFQSTAWTHIYRPGTRLIGTLCGEYQLSARTLPSEHDHKGKRQKRNRGQPGWISVGLSDAQTVKQDHTLVPRASKTTQNKSNWITYQNTCYPSLSQTTGKCYWPPHLPEDHAPSGCDITITSIEVMVVERRPQDITTLRDYMAG
jgi:hypothetical protein